MYQIPDFELLPAVSTHLTGTDSYDSDMSYVIYDNPDEVPNTVTIALPSSSQNLNLPDGTVSLMHERIKNILSENIFLKEKMKNGNRVMTEQINNLSSWHNQIYQTHEKYRDMIKNLTKQNKKLQAENQELEKKLEDNEHTFVVCEKNNNIGDSSCVENTLLQNSDLPSQISDNICKFREEKTDVENYKKLLDKEKELQNLQETHKFVQNEYYNSLSIIAILEEDKKKLTLIIRKLEASISEITQEKQDKDFMFKRTSDELEELKASQEKSDELRKQSSERLSEMTATLLDTQKKLTAAEETAEGFKRTSKELEELKASQEKSDELRKQSSERLSELTVTLADTQKKLETTEETVEELKNTLKEMETLKASHERSEEMRKESSEALSKVTATLTEVTATLTDNQKKLMATEAAVEKLENELKLKEEELKASQDAYKELTKQHTEKLEMLAVTQNKLVAAEEAAKNLNEGCKTLECDALKYKEELEKVQSRNRENMRNIDELKRIIASYSDEVKKSNAECKRHKENQIATELTLVKISEEQERWKRVDNSLKSEISDSEISSAWEQVHILEGPEKETAYENLITAYQEQLEAVTTTLYNTRKVLEEEQEKNSQLNTSIHEIVTSSNEAVNDLLTRSSYEAGASANQSATVASTFSCPGCSCCFEDIFNLQCHVEECLPD